MNNNIAMWGCLILAELAIMQDKTGFAIWWLVLAGLNLVFFLISIFYGKD